MSAPLFTAGDFIAAPESVFMKIVTVIPGSPNLYAIGHVKSDHLHWMSEQQLLEQEFKHDTPKFAQFESVRSGDIIAMGNNTYVKILAIADNAVLLSQPPDEGAGFILNIAREMQEKGGHVVMPEEAEKQLKQAASSHKAYNRPGQWFDRHSMALMNWRIVRD